MITSRQSTVIHHFASRHFASSVLSAALLTVTGCKPAAAPNTNQLQPPDDQSVQRTSSTVRQPSANDLASFLRSIAPPTSKVVEVKSDPAVLMPGSNVWVVNVRLVFAPTEDLLGPPSNQDAQAFEAITNELAELLRWGNAYMISSYAGLYPAFKSYQRSCKTDPVALVES